jgi:hypothetical protein
MVSDHDDESGASLGFKQLAPPNPRMATHPCADSFACVSNPNDKNTKNIYFLGMNIVIYKG